MAVFHATGLRNGAQKFRALPEIPLTQKTQEILLPQ
jgi:hypothetical protein